MNRIFLFILSITILIADGQAQDTNIVKFLPLKVGNAWVYYFTTYSYWFGSSRGYKKYVINGTVQHIGKTFFTCSLITRFIEGQYVCPNRVFDPNWHIRIDSATGKVMVWEYCNPDHQEYMVDSLFSKLNDSASRCGSNQNRVVCNDTSWQSIFNYNNPSKRFHLQGVEAGESRRYIKHFGISSWGYFDLLFSCSSELRGCIINGILYGDTSMVVGIIQVSNEVPSKFQLYQNYPNPFNPITKIRFDVPPEAMTPSSYESPVQLIVYDILGRRISTLVSEQHKPGTYEVEWDASNYPSGVYYYKLLAGDYTESRKMALIK